MRYQDVMAKAQGLVSIRGKDYGDISTGLTRARDIFFATTGVNLTLRELALVLHSVKMARMYDSPGKLDHYLDGVNYLAFAATLMLEDESAKSANQPVPIAPAPFVPSPAPLKPLNLSERAVAAAVEVKV